jgi:hypothetical protein
MRQSSCTSAPGLGLNFVPASWKAHDVLSLTFNTECPSSTELRLMVAAMLGPPDEIWPVIFTMTFPCSVPRDWCAPDTRLRLTVSFSSGVRDTTHSSEVAETSHGPASPSRRPGTVVGSVVGSLGTVAVSGICFGFSPFFRRISVARIASSPTIHPIGR